MLFVCVAHFGALHILNFSIMNKTRIYPDKPTSTVGRSGSGLISHDYHRDPSGYETIQPDPTSGALDELLDRSSDSEGIRFGETLRELLNGNTDPSALLAILLHAGDGNFTDERWDMFYQYLLQVINSRDQRAYDEGKLQESRLYNNPTNELARLMAAGVSRDKAIELLSNGSGSGSGSLIGSGAGATAPSPTATSGTQELQRQQNTFGYVMGAFNMLSQLIGTGMNMAQSIEQIKGLQAQNSMLQYQSESFGAVQQLTQSIQSLQASGAIESSDLEGMTNANDLIKFLQSHAKDNEQLAELVASPAYTAALGTPFGRQYFNQWWKSMRDTRDEGTLYDEFIRQQRLQNSLLSVQTDKVGAEMALMGKQGDLIEQQIIESTNRIAVGDAQIKVLNQQGEYIDVQRSWHGKVAQATIDNLEAQADAAHSQSYLNYQNASLAEQQFEYNSAGFPMLKQNRIDAIQQEALKWSLIKSPEGRMNAMKTWLMEEQNAVAAAYAKNLYLNAVGNFATQYPGMYNWSVGLNASGLLELVKTDAEAGATAAGALKVGADIIKVIPK